MTKKEIIDQIKSNAASVFENLSPAELAEKSVACGEGRLTDHRCAGSGHRKIHWTFSKR